MTRDPDKGKSVWSRVAAGLVAAAVLYVLSPGPVAWVLMLASEKSLPWTEEAWEAFTFIYQPLDLATEHVEVVQVFYDRYFQLLGLGE